MKISLFPFYMLLLFLLACKEEDIRPNVEVKQNVLSILPLGDSRVQGARPEFESYRFELWKKLVENNWQVDFVGSRRDEATYPSVMGQSFDNDHEGTGGATTGDIIQTLDRLPASFAPEVVLLGIGGNDLIDEEGITASSPYVRTILGNIDQIIDLLQARNDSVYIFLEQIAPGTTDFMSTRLTTVFEQFNNGLPEIATNQTTATSQVVVVDMASGWLDSYMADAVHYNEAGASVIADRYYEAMVNTITP